MAIRFLSTIEEWKEFSNLAAFSFELEGETWPSVEHYYQYKKFETAKPEVAAQIKAAETGKDVKKISDANKPSPADWKDRKVDVIRKAVKAKFLAHPKLTQKLLGTGGEELVEANPDDQFWGEGDGTGQNVMGKLLMEIREELQ